MANLYVSHDNIQCVLLHTWLKKIHKIMRKNIHECKIQSQDSAIQCLCPTAVVMLFALVYIFLGPIFSQTLEAGYTDRFYVVLSVPLVNSRL